MGADPKAVGERLLQGRERWRTIACHELADMLPWDELPAFDPEQTLASSTHKQYHDELQERARQGDRYATSLLLGRHNDDPGG